jgi:hypothetical protein
MRQHILKLNIHMHPFVAVTQNPTHTHVNSSKRVHDSTRKAQKKFILKVKTGRKKNHIG